MQRHNRSDGGVVQSTVTLFEVVQVPELHEVVAIVIVSDVDLGILGQGILHPGTLIAPITVLLLWQFNRC